jgi:Dolichyl-phosphate-mannose-protein mannosyltransferase
MARFEALAENTGALLSRRLVWTVAALSCLFFTTAVLRAHGLPFWYDEISTLFLADLPSAGAVAHAVLNGGDLMPPVCHLAIHFVDSWFGTGEVVSRIPGMLGFWLYCLCLFHFVYRRAGIYYAIAATLLPAVTQSFHFAFEARAYGITLGCAGSALICWQAALRGQRRTWTLPGLALSLAGALSTQYYAVLLLVPFAGAEVWRTIGRRKVDWPVWAAFFGGVAPLGLFALRIRRIAGSVNDWTPPPAREYIAYYQGEFEFAILFLILLLALAALYAACGGTWRGSAGAPSLATSSYEWLAAALFLTAPLIVITAARYVTHAYAPRYAVVGITGVLLLIPLALHAVSRGSTMAGFLLLLAAGLPFAAQTAAGIPKFVNPLDREPLLRAELVKGNTVVLTDAFLFLRISYYAPAALRSQLVYVADPKVAAAYGGEPILDNGILSQRRYLSATVSDYATFANSHTDALVYFDLDRSAWQLAKIIADGGDLSVLARDHGRTLYRARFAR